MKKTFFHEDDFGQIEVLPIINYEFCSDQMKKIASFSKEHQEGLGWNDIFVHSESSIPLACLKIKKEDMKVSLGSILIEYENVYTGYGSYEELSTNTVAYGDQYKGQIFFCYDDMEIVTAIWCTDLVPEICKIPRADELLVVDWSWGFVSPLNDVLKIEHYICEKSSRIRENYEAWESMKTMNHNHKKTHRGLSTLIQDIFRFIKRK